MKNKFKKIDNKMAYISSWKVYMENGVWNMVQRDNT